MIVTAPLTKTPSARSSSEDSQDTPHTINTVTSDSKHTFLHDKVVVLPFPLQVMYQAVK